MLNSSGACVPSSQHSSLTGYIPDDEILSQETENQESQDVKNKLSLLLSAQINNFSKITELVILSFHWCAVHQLQWQNKPTNIIGNHS